MKNIKKLSLCQFSSNYVKDSNTNMCKTYLHTKNIKSEMHNTPSHRKEENRLLSHECTHHRHDTFMCLLGVTLRRAKNAATLNHAKTNNHNDYHNHHRRVLTRDQKPPSIEQIATNSDNSRKCDNFCSWKTITFLAEEIFSHYYGNNAMKKNSHQYKYSSSFYSG